MRKIAQSLIAATLVMAWAAESAANDGRPPRVLDHSEIEWVRRPTGDDIVRYYPDKASRREVAGWGSAVCRVKKDGSLEACMNAAESPEDWNFGDATVAMSRLFRMKPVTKTGDSVEGALVLLRISFQGPSSTAPRNTAMPGFPVLLLRPLPEGTFGGPGRIKCRTASGIGFCSIDELWPASWAHFTEVAPIIPLALPQPSLMECSGRQDGTLAGCTLSGEQPEAVRAATLALADRYRLPPTQDRQDAGKDRVILTFDWPTLKKVHAAVVAVAQRD